MCSFKNLDMHSAWFGNLIVIYNKCIFVILLSTNSSWKQVYYKQEVIRSCCEAAVQLKVVVVFFPILHYKTVPAIVIWISNVPFWQNWTIVVHTRPYAFHAAKKGEMQEDCRFCVFLTWTFNDAHEGNATGLSTERKDWIEIYVHSLYTVIWVTTQSLKLLLKKNCDELNWMTFS